MFRLRFPPELIGHWASRYPYAGDEDIERRLEDARLKGYLEREEFLALCRWKSPRSQPRCKRNRTKFVREVTRASLSAEDEELKIRVLLLLGGSVGRPRP